MNNTFSMRRVMWYGRKHYLENARGYLYGLLGLCALLAFMMIVYEGGIVFVQTMILGCAAVYCVQLTCRSHYDKLQSACSYTLPVTQVEKFLFIWFNSVVICSAVIMLIGLFATWCGSLIYENNVGLRDKDDYYFLWWNFFGMQSAALFVCCWLKGSPLRGYLIMFGIFVALYTTYFWFWRRCGFSCEIPLSEVNGWVSCDGAAIRYGLDEKMMSSLAANLIMGLWIPVLWVAAYFKFRERTLK